MAIEHLLVSNHP